MSITHDEWLHLAKRCAVGQTTRHHHGRERRPNLVVGNKDDRYWAYCNACKTGGVVMKEHVVITGRSAPAESAHLTLPHDMVRVLDADKAVQDAVLGFLAHKNMDAQYLPELWFSKERCRVLLNYDGAWLGRDTTERSPQKWLTYSGSNHLGPYCGVHPLAVVVEDTFSFYKVAWALAGRDVSVYCSLGTKLSNDLMINLLQHDRVLMFYDGDTAGNAGAVKESHRLRACGVSSNAWTAPPDLDPKDMSIYAIREYI